MLALLRLDAAVLLRAWPTLVWVLALAAIPAYTSLDSGSDESSTAAAGFLSGSTAFMGLLGWFLHLGQVDGLAALAPVPSRRRALHHLVVLAFAALLPAGAAALLAGPLAGAAAGLAAVGGWTIFLLAARHARRAHPWVYAGLLAALAFLSMVGIGIQAWIGATPLWIAVEVGAVAVLAYVYAGSPGLEYGGTSLLHFGQTRPARASTTARPQSMAGVLRPAPLLVLFKTAYVRGVALFFGVGVLLCAAVPGAALTVCVMSALAIQWPLHVWSFFQATPFSRRSAFLALMAPLMLWWILALALGAVVYAAQRDTRFNWSDDDAVMLGHPDGWNSSSRLGLKGGALYPVPSEPSAAAWSVSLYLERVFALRVSPAEILAMRPEGTPVATAEWMQTVETRLQPRIRAVAAWLAALSSLEILIAMLLASSIYYLRRRHVALYGAALAAFVLAASFVPGLRDGSAGHLPFYYREIHVARPELLAVVLSAVCLLLVLRHYAAFVRLQSGDLAWNAGRPSTSE